MSNEQRNVVVCPRCGEVKLETPPGTTVLPTLGMARKAAGAGEACECGKRREDAAPEA
jgi:hypothetical protein